VLSTKQALLDALFVQAGERLSEFTKDKEKYHESLKNLVLEGLYALNEEHVWVRARRVDYDLVKRAIEAATKEYEEKLGKEVRVEIDERGPLPEGS